MISVELNQSFSSPRSSTSCSVASPRLSAPKPIQSNRSVALRPRSLRKMTKPADAEQAERQVDEKHPAPVVNVGEIAAERRADHRPDHHADAPQRHGFAPCFP